MPKLPHQLTYLLDAAVPPALASLYTTKRDHLAREFMDHRREINRPPALDDQGQLVVQVVRFGSQKLGQVQQRIQDTQQLLDDFNYRYSRAGTTKEQHRIIMNLARDLGAGWGQLLGDLRALSRRFGHEAVSERCTRRISWLEAEIVYLLTVMGALAPIGLQNRKEQGQVWEQMSLEPRVTALVTYSGDSRVRLQAFRCLTSAVQALNADARQDHVAQGTLTFMYRCALERREEVWVQAEALHLLKSLSVTTLLDVAGKRLAQAPGGDDLFVRRRCVDILGQILAEDGQGEDLLAQASCDHSPYVRQGVVLSAVQALSSHDLALWPVLERLASQDETVEVRAWTQVCLRLLLESSRHRQQVLKIWAKALVQDQDSLVRKAVLRAVSQGGTEVAAQNKAALDELEAAMLPLLEYGHQQDPDGVIRRWSAQVRERLYVESWPELRKARTRLLDLAGRVKPGQSFRLPRDIAQKISPDDLYRVLSVLAQEDYGFTVMGLQGRRILRGDRFVFRLWRTLFELFHPSPYKRQGYVHTKGRILLGRVRIPSALMAELTRTNVPGEPLYIPDEDGWRPYLPLVDDVLSSLTLSWTSQPVRIVSSEGTTRLTPPKSLLKRLRAWWRLTTRFAHYARLRNWQPEQGFAPTAYASALSELGFELSLSGHPGSQTDQDVDSEAAKFFPLWIPFVSPATWEAFREYFFSVYGNTLYELGVFAGAVLLLFLGRRLYLSLALDRDRRKLPLVIGGWGTRGKSGTERLKAAVFEALGYGTICKTTGTESMFLMTPPMGSTREMLLFRPYDKATIWEQHAMLRWAAGMDTEVMLWECMGLNPSYVSILQRHWSRDDLATITNAYPDHEDIQGPAGRDIPLVMREFIPENKVLITTEEQMRPILREGARQKKTACLHADWLDAALIPGDIMDRFPYQEHPANIALVLRLAQELGIDPDRALFEMATRVVPDIGVLKAFPQAECQGRYLEFVNGMAANERHATLSNWQRMGFAHQDLTQQATGMQTLVVNNRADRISRSRMFASIVVQDLSADLILLIGSNVTGLMGFIRQAWTEFMDQYLSPNTDISPVQGLASLAGHLRIPTQEWMIEKRVQTILDTLQVDYAPDTLSTFSQDPQTLSEYLQKRKWAEMAQDISQHVQTYRARHTAYTQLMAQASQEKGDEQWMAKARETVQAWFLDKISVIEDPHVSGEAVVHRMVQISPPGMHNRIMGIQNIKGPGLEFVSRWQAWESCHTSCSKLLAQNEATVREGLRELVGFQDYSLLCESFVVQTLEQVRPRQVAQSEYVQASLSLIERTMNRRLDQVKQELYKSPGHRGLLIPLLNFVEAFLDAGDGVRRRKAANRIYKDLAKARISHDQAVMALREVNKRQKGGWLAVKFGVG